MRTTDRERESIGSRLALIAARLPDRTAIVEGGAQVSFGQLDSTAAAIAHCVQAAARARPGAIGLLFENRIPAIAAIFAAAKTDRAYVPVDAGDPDERLRFILADSEPIALLTEASLLERARALAPRGCTVMDIGDACADDNEPALPKVDADALANVYYTSGSTGQPKGVCQTHRNVLYFVDAYARTLRIAETDRVSLLYTLSFSASMMDIFGCLFNGATLCVYDVRAGGVAELAKWLDRELVSVLHCVPTVFRGLFNGLESGRRLEHLRAIDLGGEAVFASDVELFRQHTRADCILVNHLAATEANVIAQHVIDHGDSAALSGIVAAGRTPDGLSVRVRRADGSDAAVGEKGRIVVSSVHVSPRYWKRPDLDAATFSQDAKAPGVVSYVSSDLGYLDEHGDLHFIGRESSRAKIRGQSIDLSEIEAALAAWPGVVRSAVVASNDGSQPEATKLTAYVVFEEHAERSPLTIRHFLAARLPSYMLPTAFAFPDALPLTPTGKIDRLALAAMAPPSAARSRELEPPRDDVERAVAAMFEQLLQQAPIGRADDFFLLGGDSLSLVELQTRILEQFGVSLPRVHVDASVAAIAENIRRGRERAPGARSPVPVLLPLREGAGGLPLFLVHGRLGQAFVSRQFLDLVPGELAVWALQARGLDGLGEPNLTIEAMAADYVSEMRKLRPHGPYFIAALCAGALIANEMARTLQVAGEPVLPLLLFDPPGKNFRDGIADERLAARLAARRGAGLYSTPLDDPQYATAAVRTAKAFELAIRAYEPKPYDGPVYMLSSRQRIHARSQAYWKTIFTGPLQRFAVGTTHDEALDARSPVFAEHLVHCFKVILAVAQKSGAMKALPDAAGALAHERSRP
jgi:amino acid adenylation domain-containing protein